MYVKNTLLHKTTVLYSQKSIYKDKLVSAETIKIRSLLLFEMYNKLKNYSIIVQKILTANIISISKLTKDNKLLTHRPELLINTKR